MLDINAIRHRLRFNVRLCQASGKVLRDAVNSTLSLAEEASSRLTLTPSCTGSDLMYACGKHQLRSQQRAYIYHLLLDVCSSGNASLKLDRWRGLNGRLCMSASTCFLLNRRCEYLDFVAFAGVVNPRALLAGTGAEKQMSTHNYKEMW